MLAGPARCFGALLQAPARNLTGDARSGWASPDPFDTALATTSIRSMREHGSRDPGRLVPAVMLSHRAVTGVQLAGSRARAETTALSDWDFEVTTISFDAVAADLEGLVAAMGALASQWDPFGGWPTYMVMLPGPAKVDLAFRAPAREAVPLPEPWEVTARTLGRIDHHFWDWSLWLGSKTLRCDRELLDSELVRMSIHLLRPLGEESVPHSLEEAVAVFLHRRAAAEARLGVALPRQMGDEVQAALIAALGEHLDGPLRVGRGEQPGRAPLDSLHGR
jgi:hypothetical protein